MKESYGKIKYKGKEYILAFNLNVMQAIQEKYETTEQWGALTDGSNGEPNAEAIIYGFTEMINEGIDIENEEKGTELKPFTLKQVGRMISEIGIGEAATILSETVIESTKSDEEKNV